MTMVKKQQSPQDKEPQPAPFAESMYEITKMIGTKPDLSLYKKSASEKRVFTDRKGTFYEMEDKREKGKKIVAE